MSLHHQRAFDKGLDDLKRKLLHMADVAEDMIDKSVEELVKRDGALADPVRDHEQELNRLQIEIDEQALMMLATQQPVAQDLRFLVAAMKINSDLERIGDLAMNITQNAQVLLAQPPLKPLIDIPRMGDTSGKMVRESMDALINRDVIKAQAVIMKDDEVDALKNQVIRELLTYMIGDTQTIERGLALILVSRHLERIADHAVNIAQDVIYMVQGRDVRHPRAREKATASK